MHGPSKHSAHAAVQDGRARRRGIDTLAVGCSGYYPTVDTVRLMVHGAPVGATGPHRLGPIDVHLSGSLL